MKTPECSEALMNAPGYPGILRRYLFKISKAGKHLKTQEAPERRKAGKGKKKSQSVKNACLIWKDEIK
ncbi:MAG: hypothetical protein LBT40_07975 [Deltaproteobacteria bacterium]|nr:hypothetical protein [Deltaproteobacteria bacterium]